MHEYSVEFRIYGKELDILEVTSDLGYQPSSFKIKGELIGTKYSKYSLWGYDGSETGGEPIYWDSLEDGLKFLLGRLNPVKDKIDRYKSKYKVILWCGHFQSGFDGGPTLSPSLLKELGDFGVSLFIDNYFSAES